VKHAAGPRLAIVNPLSLVGNEVKLILGQRSFPYEKLVLLDSSGQTAGAVTEAGDEPAIVAPISELELEDVDLVFFCGPPASNREWIEKHATLKFIAVDLSQPTTAEEGKVAIAGMNVEALVGETLIVSPHPVAVPIALVLHQLQSLAPVKACTAAVVQPASEFEQAGVEELAQQTVAVLNIKSVPRETFDRQLAFNMYPALERNEEFIVRQIRGLLDPRMELALFITQGTVFHNHTFSLFVRMRDDIAIDRVEQTLRSNPILAFSEGDQTVGTIDAAGRDEVLIAEVRADPTIAGGFWVWAVCDNLRRSSALNAVLIAEKLLFDVATN
jgi:aspartate-semialdehyde dehydrogenase